MMKHLILLSVFTVTAILNSPISQAMNGGWPANGPEWNASVAIRYTPENKIKKNGQDIKLMECTATFLSPNILLSVAHCIAPLFENKIIVINREFQKSSGKIARVKRIEIHPLYDAESEKHYLYDIGFIELDSDTSQSIPVHEYPKLPRDPIVPNETLTLVGAGDITMEKSGRPLVKKFAYFTVHTKTEKDLFTLLKSREASPCEGDSGGGIFRRKDGVLFLVGMTIGISGGCGPEGYTAAYDLRYAISWLQEKTGLSL